jgi:hypothetical protein
MNFAASTFREVEATETDREIERALRVVHERFGGDLRVFFRQIRKLQEEQETGSPEAILSEQLMRPQASDQSKS